MILKNEGLRLESSVDMNTSYCPETILVYISQKREKKAGEKVAGFNATHSKYLHE